MPKKKPSARRRRPKTLTYTIHTNRAPVRIEGLPTTAADRVDEIFKHELEKAEGGLHPSLGPDESPEFVFSFKSLAEVETEDLTAELDRRAAPLTEAFLLERLSNEGLQAEATKRRLYVGADSDPSLRERRLSAEAYAAGKRDAVGGSLGDYLRVTTNEALFDEVQRRAQLGELAFREWYRLGKQYKPGGEAATHVPEARPRECDDHVADAARYIGNQRSTTQPATGLETRLNHLDEVVTCLFEMVETYVDKTLPVMVPGPRHGDENQAMESSPDEGMAINRLRAVNERISVFTAYVERMRSRLVC